MLLEATLTTHFQPGTNLKGGSAGGNWSYVLPDLERELVVVLGVPSSAALVTLSRTAQRVLVICQRGRPFRSAKLAIEQLNLGQTVQLQRSTRGFAAGLPDHGADVLVLSNRAARWQFAWHRRFRSECYKCLKPGGQIYFESSQLEYSLLSLGSDFPENAQMGLRLTPLWITPLCGESQTFVPYGDRATVLFFKRRRLAASSLRADLWKRRSALASTAGAATKSSSPGEMPSRQPPAAQRRTMRETARQFLKPVVRWARAWIDRAESFLNQPFGIAQFAAKRGSLIQTASTTIGNPITAPPRYLCDIAQQFGISLDSFRWGLSATGDYDSRKLIFFLFGPERLHPQYVVKMTRSEVYNRRLNIERTALEQLEELGIGDLSTLPRIAFAGTNGGLAIVGETAIDGVPFDQRTTADGSCPHARAAVRWLTEMGAVTAAPFAAEPEQVAAGLHRLLARFAELYSITQDEYSFLAGQIAVLEFTRIPLVFQHGDPGRWNVFVTPTGRVSFLDWEAAERHGMPLWDVFYFLRSFAACVAESQHAGEGLVGLETVFLRNSPVAELAIETVRNYCGEIGLPARCVEPLFHTCWMHRALKESTRLPASRLRHGHYFNFFRMCKEQRESPTLRQLFAPN